MSFKLFWIDPSKRNELLIEVMDIKTKWCSWLGNKQLVKDTYSWLGAGSVAVSAAARSSIFPVSRSTFFPKILSIIHHPTNQLGIAKTSLVKMLLKLLSGSIVLEPNGIVSRLYLTVSKVFAEECKRSVTSSTFFLQIHSRPERLQEQS